MPMPMRMPISILLLAMIMVTNRRASSEDEIFMVCTGCVRSSVGEAAVWDICQFCHDDRCEHYNRDIAVEGLASNTRN